MTGGNDRRLTLILIGLLALSAAASLGTGTVNIEAWAAMTGGDDAAARVILMEIRLPRMLAAALVGATLGMAGAAMQGLLRNPLAEPGVLGISAFATLGATVALYFGFAAVSALAVPLAAMAGALAAMLLLATTAMTTRGVATLILVGVAMSSLAGAVMALLLNFAPNPFSLSDLVNWTLGSVANRSLPDIARTAPFMLAGMALMLMQRRALTALTLGEDTAASLGLDLPRTRLIVILGTGMATGAAVALAGAIGFVGIIAPHLVRPWVGHDPARTLLPSALAGAVALVLADLLIRLAPTGTELRLGVVAALVGAPIFLIIAWRRGNVRHG